jgi:hypothetical protein
MGAGRVPSFNYTLAFTLQLTKIIGLQKVLGGVSSVDLSALLHETCTGLLLSPLSVKASVRFCSAFGRYQVPSWIVPPVTS